MAFPASNADAWVTEFMDFGDQSGHGSTTVISQERPSANAGADSGPLVRQQATAPFDAYEYSHQALIDRGATGVLQNVARLPQYHLLSNEQNISVPIQREPYVNPLNLYAEYPAETGAPNTYETPAATWAAVDGPDDSMGPPAPLTEAELDDILAGIEQDNPFWQDLGIVTPEAAQAMIPAPVLDVFGNKAQSSAHPTSHDAQLALSDRTGNTMRPCDSAITAVAQQSAIHTTDTGPVASTSSALNTMTDAARRPTCHQSTPSQKRAQLKLAHGYRHQLERMQNQASARAAKRSAPQPTSTEPSAPSTYQFSFTAKDKNGHSDPLELAAMDPATRRLSEQIDEASGPSLHPVTSTQAAGHGDSFAPAESFTPAPAPEMGHYLDTATDSQQYQYHQVIGGPSQQLQQYAGPTAYQGYGQTAHQRQPVYQPQYTVGHPSDVSAWAAPVAGDTRQAAAVSPSWFLPASQWQGSPAYIEGATIAGTGGQLMDMTRSSMAVPTGYMQHQTLPPARTPRRYYMGLNGELVESLPMPDHMLQSADLSFAPAISAPVQASAAQALGPYAHGTAMISAQQPGKRVKISTDPPTMMTPTMTGTYGVGNPQLRASPAVPGASQPVRLPSALRQRAPTRAPVPKIHVQPPPEELVRGNTTTLERIPPPATGTAPIPGTISRPKPTYLRDLPQGTLNKIMPYARPNAKSAAMYVQCVYSGEQSWAFKALNRGRGGPVDNIDKDKLFLDNCMLDSIFRQVEVRIVMDYNGSYGDKAVRGLDATLPVWAMRRISLVFVLDDLWPERWIPFVPHFEFFKMLDRLTFLVQPPGNEDFGEKHRKILKDFAFHEKGLRSVRMQRPAHFIWARAGMGDEEELNVLRAVDKERVQEVHRERMAEHYGVPAAARQEQRREAATPGPSGMFF